MGLISRIEAGERLGLPNHEIACAIGIPENEVAMAQEDRQIALNNAERSYDRAAIQRGINEWLAEPEMQEARKQHLIESAIEAAREPNNPKHNALRYKIRAFMGDGVTPEKIARAREYPITNLIKSTRGMAVCPFHKDKTPSMDIRKNFYHCYGCGERGDVIDFVMKTENLSFKQAVERLA